jgi:hypothetical protein
MATIPKQTLVNRIDAVEIESYSRPHLGYSEIGKACARSLVYSFYWSHKRKVGARLERIFRTGDDVEERLVQSLRSVGIAVDQGFGGEQIRVKHPSGHAGGSLDGILTGVPEFEGMKLVFEGKSMNHTNFLDVKRNGVEKSKYTHYVQMNMYMGAGGHHFALYMALDKNTSEIYIEMVPFDYSCYEFHLDRVDHVLTTNHVNEFTKTSNNPSWFTCKMCDSKGVCHGGEAIAENCRTCENVELIDDGTWSCSLQESSVLSVKEQEDGCGHYVLGEMWI